MTRERLLEAVGTNFIANTGGTYSKSSQWITLWAVDAFRLLEDREKIKNEWMFRARVKEGDWLGLAPLNRTIRGAFDELVFIHEAHARNMTIRNETLTYVEWHHHTGGGHPDVFYDKNQEDEDSIEHALFGALRHNKTFIRKIDETAMPFFMKQLHAASLEGDDPRLTHLLDIFSLEAQRLNNTIIEQLKSSSSESSSAAAAAAS